jgi:cytochrome P450
MLAERPGGTKIPGPRGLPGIGWVGNVTRFYRDPIGYLRQLHRRHGDVVAIARNDPRYVFVFGPQYVRELLTNTEHFHLNSFLMPRKPGTSLDRMLTNLLSMNGQRYKQQRRLLNPAFHSAGVRPFRDDIVHVAERWAERWRVGQRLDLLHEMQELALSVACKSFFGLDTTDSAAEVLDVVRPVARYLYSLPALLFPFDLPGTPYRTLQRVAERFEALVREIIAHKRRGNEAHHDILSTMLETRDEDGTRLTDAELVGHITALTVAGHETTAGAMAWTLFLLAEHPAIREALLDELRTEVGSRPPTIEELKRLPLLERVVRESLRLLPPVPYIARHATRPCRVGAWDIPAGAILVLSPFMLHHTPALYARPERFDPDRWLTLERSPYELIPFGAGPRTCIGAAFAWMEIKLVIATLLPRFHLVVSPDAVIDRQARPFLLAARGIPVEVHPPGDRTPPARIRGNIRELVELP